MVIRKELPDDQLSVLRSAMKPYDVVRVRARLAEESVFGSPQGLLTDFMGKDTSDSDLNSYASELQEAVTFVNPMFGLFTLDRRVDWYEATPEWCGGSVRLAIRAGTPDEMEKSLATARRLWAEQEEWQRKITACATKELLESKNDTWLAEDALDIMVSGNLTDGPTQAGIHG